MKVSHAALLALLAVLCVPVALALSSPASLPAAGLPDVPAPPPVEVPQVPVRVDADVEAAAGVAGAGVDLVDLGVAARDGHVQVGSSGAPAAMGTSSSRASLVEKSAAVAGQAAGAGALTLLAVAAGSGLDGLRALLARPTARLQQAGRLLLRFLPFLPFLPLFSRIEGQKVLENPVRARVHEVVVNDPGLSLEEVRARAGIAWGTAVHHLRRLENTGLLVSVAQSARRRYFAANTPASRNRTQVAALAHPTTRRVADLVRQRPGVDQTGLCEALGLRNPAASKHLGQLAAQGLVLAQRLGRRCHYHPTEALHTAFGILEAPAQVRVTAPASAVPA
ncbi:MAG TPA: hypothetical protein VHI93_06385 [Candidatus Thermoplasmatota archaeon]|nr:hypothetical protein [Candidatus Thermoplasmatota archaeon]